MSVWDTIIRVGDDAWQRKPRKELARALVELRDAIKQCQSAYEEYREMFATGNYNAELERRRKLARNTRTIYSDPERAWSSAYVSLVELLDGKVGKLLEISSPEIHDAVESYKAPDPPARFHDDASLLRSVAVNAELRSAFERAMAKIDGYIRDNFKIEEIYNAE
jgi:hypothetical protein